MAIMRIGLFTALWITCACTVVPAEPPAPPSPDGDVYDRACQNERQLECGVRDNCADVFRKAVETRITAVSEETAECIVKADSKEAVRACGYADCP